MKWIGLALFELLCIPLALVGAPIVALFARWDERPTTWTGGASQGPLVVRGDLPDWARWWGTFDERLPGGMYEPTVYKVYERFGRYWCSVYWLVVRNRMFGLAGFLFGRPDGPHKPFHYQKIGPLYLGWGWKRYRASPFAGANTGPYVLIPSVTVRIASTRY